MWGKRRSNDQVTHVFTAICRLSMRTRTPSSGSADFSRFFLSNRWGANDVWTCFHSSCKLFYEKYTVSSDGWPEHYESWRLCGIYEQCSQQAQKNPTLAFCGNYFRKSKSCDQLMWTNIQPVIRSSWQNENTKDKIKAYFRCMRQEKKRFKTGNLLFNEFMLQTNVYFYLLFVYTR